MGWSRVFKIILISRQDAEMFNSPRARTQRKQDNVPGRNANTYAGFNEEGERRNCQIGRNLPAVWQINPEAHSSCLCGRGYRNIDRRGLEDL